MKGSIKMGSNKTETELKLVGCVNNQLKYAGDMAESVLNKLIHALKLLDITCNGDPEEIIQHDIYFDTAQQHIQQAKGSLRIRIKDKKSFLTIKLALDAHIALSRDETEFPIDRKENDLKIVTPYFHKYFPQFQDRDLVKVLEVFNRRYCIPIQTVQGKYDLCFDKYYYYCASSGEQSDPLYEIEIEQVSGAKGSIEDDKDIARLSSLLTVLLGFQADLTSKYTKGIQWLKTKDCYDSRIFVLFDLVSYSQKPAYLQKKLVLEFTKLIQPILEGVDCIKIPIGDGVIIGFSPNYNVVAFLHKLYLRLHRHNKDLSDDMRLEIRASLHYGLVYEYTDINKNMNYAGNGINIVARIGSQTAANQVLISEECYSYLNNTEHIQAESVSVAQEITVKHGLVLTVRNYRDARANIGVPHDTLFG